MNNLEEMIPLINIINTDLFLSLYLSMMSCFNLKVAYTNYEFTKYFLIYQLNSMSGYHVPITNITCT